jgi:hypothetical protein
MFVPCHPGELNISGIELEYFNGLYNSVLGTVSNLNSTRIKAGKVQLIPQTEVSKNIKSKLESPPTLKSPGKESNLILKVVPKQPLLKFISSSIGTHQNIVLFRGEQSRLVLKVKNMGNVAIDWISIKVEDECVSSEKPLGFEKQVFWKNINAAYLITDESEPKSKTISKNVGALSNFTRLGVLEPIQFRKNLDPGSEFEIKLGIFGKRDW